MSLDPVVTSAIIGLAGVIGGYAVQNYFSRRADREIERFKLKREKYDDLVKQIATEIHLVQTSGGSTPDELKESMDMVSNTLWLYASDDVMRYLTGYLGAATDKDVNTSFRKLIYAMRKDLMNTKMTESEVTWFRAT